MEEEKLSDKDLEVIFKETDKEFTNGYIEELEGNEVTITEVDDTPSTEDILIALGFIRYDNQEKGIAYKLKAGPLQIGRTYTEKYPIGNMWVRCLVDCEHGKKDEFLKRDILKEIPLVALFYDIRDNNLAIPEPIVKGKVVGKSEKAVQIQFSEFNQIRTQWWGLGALKKSEESITYIPASYSKETEKYDSKMQVPRDIILEKYDAEMKKAPVIVSNSDVGWKEETPKERVISHTLADKIHAPEPKPKEEPIVSMMHFYLKEGRKMVEDVFPELEQPQLSEISQDIATSLFIESNKQLRKERW